MNVTKKYWEMDLKEVKSKVYSRISRKSKILTVTHHYDLVLRICQLLTEKDNILAGSITRSCELQINELLVYHIVYQLWRVTCTRGAVLSGSCTLTSTHFDFWHYKHNVWGLFMKNWHVQVIIQNSVLQMPWVHGFSLFDFTRIFLITATDNLSLPTLADSWSRIFRIITRNRQTNWCGQLHHNCRQ